MDRRVSQMRSPGCGNPGTHGKVRVDVIKIKCTIIVITVTDSVLGLVVDFKDVRACIRLAVWCWVAVRSEKYLDGSWRALVRAPGACA
jgi:hypothetical protein